MSSRNMKLDEIKARAQQAFEKSEQRKREAMMTWKALEDEGNQTRLKTERLKAQRLAKEAQEAQEKADAPPPPEKKTRKRAVKAV